MIILNYDWWENEFVKIKIDLMYWFFGIYIK